MHPMDQVSKQLHKLVNVIKIRDLEPERDARPRAGAVQDLRRRGRSRRGDADLRDLPGQDRRRDEAVGVVEVTGTQDKVDAFERLVRPFGLIEMARTGEIAIARGRGET